MAACSEVERALAIRQSIDPMSMRDIMFLNIPHYREWYELKKKYVGMKASEEKKAVDEDMADIEQDVVEEFGKIYQKAIRKSSPRQKRAWPFQDMAREILQGLKCSQPLGRMSDVMSSAIDPIKRLLSRIGDIGLMDIQVAQPWYTIEWRGQKMTLSKWLKDYYDPKSEDKMDQFWHVMAQAFMKGEGIQSGSIKKIKEFKEQQKILKRRAKLAPLKQEADTKQSNPRKGAFAEMLNQIDMVHQAAAMLCTNGECTAEQIVEQLPKKAKEFREVNELATKCFNEIKTDLLMKNATHHIVLNQAQIQTLKDEPVTICDKIKHIVKMHKFAHYAPPTGTTCSWPDVMATIGKYCSGTEDYMQWTSVTPRMLEVFKNIANKAEEVDKAKSDADDARRELEQYKRKYAQIEQQLQARKDSEWNKLKEQEVANKKIREHTKRVRDISSETDDIPESPKRARTGAV